MSTITVDEPEAVKCLWKPTYKQHIFITCPVEDVLFGGGRGSAKSDGLLGDWMAHEKQYGDAATGLLIRQTYPELEEIELRCHALFGAGGLGWTWKAMSRTWISQRGGRLRLRQLERDVDAGRYQGHSYCVGVGTPVVMASGEMKPIETIKIGDYVQTLEGPRRVLDTLAPYLAMCVQASVFDRFGHFVASQIHPVAHPVLTSAGVRAPLLDDLPYTSLQSRNEISSPCRPSPKSLYGTGLDKMGWLSFLGGTQIFHEASQQKHPKIRQLHEFYGFVVLHEQTLQLARRAAGSSPGVSTQNCSLCKYVLPALRLYQARVDQYWGQKQLCGRVQLFLDRDDPFLPNEPACVLDESYTGLNSLLDYPMGNDFCGGPVLSSLRTSPVYTQELVGAGEPSRGLISGEMDTIQQCSLLDQQKYLHPYTGEERGLTEGFEVGVAVFSPYGLSYVSDIMVEDANHYITNTSMVNKNTWVGFDELQKYKSFRGVDAIRATLRSAKGAKSFFRATANPGDVGHSLVKARYVDPGPPMVPFTSVEDIGGEVVTTERCYIPATLDDNPHLMRNDPTYWQRISAAVSGNADLLRAWRYGDWNIAAGGMFTDIWDDAVHFIRPFAIPANWHVSRSFDWGSAKPFCTLWFAVSSGERLEDGRAWPRGTIFVINEDYGWSGVPDEGLRLSPRDIAKRVKLEEQRMLDVGLIARKPVPGPADDPMFDTTRGRSMAQEHADEGVLWHRPSKGKGSRVAGWQIIQQRLEASKASPMEHPGLFVFSSATNLRRTLPVLPKDKLNLDDISCFVAGTLVDTENGSVPIEEIEVGEYVHTPIGLRRVTRAGLSGYSTTMSLHLSNGVEIIATPNHKIFVENKGFIRLDMVKCSFKLIERNICQWSRESFITESNTEDILGDSTMSHLAVCYQMEGQAYTDKSGLMLMDQFQPDNASTTKTTTPTIMLSKTWLLWIAESTLPCICEREHVQTQISMHGRKQNGARPRLLKPVRKDMPQFPNVNLRAVIAASLLEQNTLHRSIVQSHAKKSTTWKSVQSHVPFAEQNSISKPTVTNKSKPAVISVAGNSGVEPVYNLTVEQAHCYYANGVLVSNSDSEDHAADALRYAILTQQGPAKVGRIRT